MSTNHVLIQAGHLVHVGEILDCLSRHTTAICIRIFRCAKLRKYLSDKTHYYNQISYDRELFCNLLFVAQSLLLEYSQRSAGIH